MAADLAAERALAASPTSLRQAAGAPTPICLPEKSNSFEKDNLGASTTFCDAASNSLWTTTGGSTREAWKRSLGAARVLKLTRVLAMPNWADLNNATDFRKPLRAFVQHSPSSTGPGRSRCVGRIRGWGRSTMSPRASRPTSGPRPSCGAEPG